MSREISFQEAYEKEFTFIDVRTPKEFKEFRIPGAKNIPLFSEEEKEEISKVYYERGEKEAKLLALKLVGPKLYNIVSKIKEIQEKEGKIVVYCWRGGQRSLSVATICSLAGVPVFRLKGGYREFRKFILKRIEEILQDKKLIVIYGPTGVGKTRLLRKLKKKGYPVIDLEELAGHRGSVFGGIGLEQPSQKMFDALLWQELEKLKNEKFLIVEGESRKIGKVFLPESLWKKIKDGINICLEIPLHERIKISLSDYGVGKYSKEVYLSALEKIRKHLGEEKFKQIKELIEKEDYKAATKRLMLDYYDKLYKKSTPNCYIKIAVPNFRECELKLEEEIRKIMYNESNSLGGKDGAKAIQKE